MRSDEIRSPVPTQVFVVFSIVRVMLLFCFLIFLQPIRFIFPFIDCALDENDALYFQVTYFLPKAQIQRGIEACTL